VEQRDFVYHFTDILFSEIVKNTILIENWEMGDFDHRYAEYASIFIKMKDAYMVAGRTDEAILTMFRNSRNTVIQGFNEKMKENFIKELQKNGTNPVVFDRILPNLLTSDEINAHSLELFRKFEEETFTQKPEKGV